MRQGESIAAYAGESTLFESITQEEIVTLLDCLGARTRQVERQEVVYRMEQPVSEIGLVLTGGVTVMREDAWGGREILSVIGPGELFGEAFACAGIPRIPVSVLASAQSELLFVEAERLLSPCTSQCPFHRRLIHNLMRMLAQRNVALVLKMEHLTRKTTRDKLLSYLSAQAQAAGGRQFSIPFDRQELADYLAVNRSALSAELSAMRAEGLIDYHKNQFKLMGQTESTGGGGV